MGAETETSFRHPNTADCSVLPGHAFFHDRSIMLAVASHLGNGRCHNSPTPSARRSTRLDLARITVIILVGQPRQHQLTNLRMTSPSPTLDCRGVIQPPSRKDNSDANGVPLQPPLCSARGWSRGGRSPDVVTPTQYLANSWVHAASVTGHHS